MQIASIDASFVPGLGFQCKIAIADGRSITFRKLSNGIRWVAKIGFLKRPEFTELHKTACRQIGALERSR
jgi:hypothetical protein